MRQRRPHLKRQRPLPRKLWSGDPMMNPRPGSEELEAWDSEFEDWMLGSPGANTPPGGV
jgi:hypothetical protein